MAAASQEKKPQVGDRIEIKRSFYSHWALYIGEDKVIHMRGVGNERLNSNSTHMFSIAGKLFDKAEVAIDFIWDVVGDDKAYINNSRDSTWTPFDAKKIINNAMKYVGQIQYNIIYANCENFVNFCRYGQWFSDQAEHVKTGLKVVGAVGATAVCVYLLCKYWDKTPTNTRRQ